MAKTNKTAAAKTNKTAAAKTNKTAAAKTNKAAGEIDFIKTVEHKTSIHRYYKGENGELRRKIEIKRPKKDE